MRRLLKKRPLALVLGMCDDKDLASFLKGFRGISKVWTVTIKNERAVPGDQLAERVRICGPDCESEELSAAMEKAEKWDAYVVRMSPPFDRGEPIAFVLDDDDDEPGVPDEH